MENMGKHKMRQIYGVFLETYIVKDGKWYAILLNEIVCTFSNLIDIVWWKVGRDEMR